MPDYTAERKIIEQAFEAAKKAATDHKAKYGEHLPCGFAWVVITPATGRLVRALKQMAQEAKARGNSYEANSYGDKHYYGGWSVWNPSQDSTQDVSIKSAGAAAFARVLRDNGYDAHPESRLD